jgi:two-component system, OmpR family, sensor kinase
MSIRRRLLVLLLSSVLLAGLAATAVAFLQAREQANTLFDYQLRQLALSLRDRAFSLEDFAQALAGDEASDFVIGVWGPDGRLLYRSHPRLEIPAPDATGFADVETRLGAWRVFSTWYRGLTIQVAHHKVAREMLAWRAAWRTLLPFLLALPVMGWLIWRQVGREMGVLSRTAQAVASRSPSSLQPIEAPSVPQEIEPLVHALNGLLERLAASLTQQRQFIADAAHELRTPLTALKLQLQLAERARDDTQRAAAHAVLRQGIDRATRVVEQLLVLARADPEANRTTWSVVDLAELARSVVATHEPLAAERGLALEAEASQPVRIRGEPLALRTLADNLVDNALRYTPSGKVAVAARVQGEDAIIEVRDTGPGIPAAERERVFDRFYRVEGAAEGGSGLGLAIARRIAEQHGGRMELDEPPSGGGLVARARLPLSPA